jgi:hypothetical protein
MPLKIFARRYLQGDATVAKAERLIASAMLRTPSRFRMRARWTSTVRMLIASLWAITLFG